MKTELLPLVHEYLEAYGYSEAAGTLKAEAQAKGEDFDPLQHEASTRENLVVVKAMEAFDRGSLSDFKHHWISALPENTRDSDSTCVRLEFYAHMYFAIVGIHPYARYKPEGYHQATAMASLRQYIEDRGTVLGNEEELLPYFAMPYIPEPQKHVTFSTLFTESWIPEIRARLEQFLLNNTGTPASRLGDIVHEWEVQAQKGKAAHAVEAITKRLEEVTEEKNELWIRHQQLQQEYYNLLGVTDELVEAVVAGIRGTPISQGRLDELCRRLNLFTAETQDTDLEAIAEEDEDDDDEEEGKGQRGGGGSAHGRRGHEQRTGSAGGGGGGRTPKRHAKAQDVVPEIVLDGPLPPLNVEKFLSALQQADTRTGALLLQALRWRVTRARPGPVRTAVIAQLTNDDVLQLGDPERDVILSLISSADETLKLCTARLLNCLGSLQRARRYLLSNDALVRRLFRQIEREDGDTPARRHLLGALQKLSLRPKAQVEMISIGVIDWLIDLLQDPDSASYYSVEYAVALLMNLCLRRKGKSYCQQRARDVLGTLLDLLSYDSAQVRTYVHACLYALFSRRVIRQEADMLGAESALRAQMRVSNVVMAKQLAHVLDQLARTDDDSEVGSGSDEEEEDEEGDDGDASGDDMTSHNLMAADHEDPEPIIASEDQAGEKLLAAYYASAASTAAATAHTPTPTAAATTTGGGGDHAPATSKSTARTTAGAVDVSHPAAAPTIATTASAREEPRPATTSGRPSGGPSRPSTGPRPSTSRGATAAMEGLRQSTAKLSQTLDALRRPATGKSRSSTNSSGNDRGEEEPTRSSSRSSRSVSRGGRPGSGPVPSKSKSGSSSVSGSGRGKGSSHGSAPKQGSVEEGGGKQGEQREGDGDEEEEDVPEPEPVPIDEEASEMLASKVGKQLAQAHDKPAPPKKHSEDANLDEYYAAFATRSKVPRTP